MRKIEHAVLSMLVASSLVACSGLPKVSEEAVKVSIHDHSVG